MDCIFCKIIEGSIPSTKILETEHVLAIENINPEAPFHALVMPKKHLELEQATEADKEILGEVLLAAKSVGTKKLPGGFRLIINTGADSNQEIDHLHVHVLGGKNLGKLLP
jgi:histidine triad (HIT) family protein